MKTKTTSTAIAKKLLLAALLLTTIAIFAACSRSQTLEDWDGEGTFTLVVGASPAPHAEILDYIRPSLSAHGIELVIREFNDFHVVNPALVDGSLGASFFQHGPFLNSFRQADELYMVGLVHVEPIGAYSLSISCISELPHGARVAFPADPANHGRALMLLQANGLLTLDPEAGILATYTSDILANPLNLNFTAMDAALLPPIMGDVDLAIVNTNHILNATNLDPMRDSLIRESAYSNPYANGLTVRVGDRGHLAVELLMYYLNSDKVRDFIWQRYDGAIVPVF